MTASHDTANSTDVAGRMVNIPNLRYISKKLNVHRTIEAYDSRCTAFRDLFSCADATRRSLGDKPVGADHEVILSVCSEYEMAAK